MIRPFLSVLLLASVAVPSLVAAQAIVQAVPGTTDADRLAGQMRLLASNPSDLDALLAAGELSLKLDDLGAAASFFARAEKVDPRNGRVKAGQAAILVHAERPGEALRYFATAESYGLQPAAFARDRGLAYDLIGEQDRAQRDYRLALRTAPDDETLRRYALSLGISGKRDLAEQQLQPLLRRQDRGAWRTRAFVEAMTGNIGEADHIATTMMPPGTAAGLQPFFARLATLGAIDRAFAVHFGEVRGTAQRVADARLAPPMAALGPDPYAPHAVAVAAVSPQATVKDKRKGKKGKQPVQVVVAAPAPEPLPQVPAYGTRVAADNAIPVASPMRSVAPTAWPAAATPMRPASGGTALPAAPALVAPPRPAVVVASPPVSASSRLPAAAAERDVRVAAVSAAAPAAAVPAPASVPAIVSPTPTPQPVQTPVTPVVAAAPPPVEIASRGAAPALWPTTINPATPPSSPVAHAAPAAAEPALKAVADEAPSTPAPAATTSPTPAPARSRAPRRDALASIVGGLPIPAAELGVTGPARAEPASAPAPQPDPAAEAEARRVAAAKALADKKAADRKAAAEKKALAEKKAAAEKKAEEAREAAAQKKLERANPERIWVQVAGGAYEGDLSKAWAAAKKKGGDVFAGHATGWTTPLRFTNRVLAGPFKTDEEARSFVNKLKAKGLSGFTFTSDAGQVVKKLGSDE